MKGQERSRLAIRALVIFWVFFALGVLLVARLYIVQVRHGERLAASARSEQRATFEVFPRRGDIVDRFGTVFATTLPSYSIYVQPPALRDARVEAVKLAPILHTDAQTLERSMRRRASFAYLARNQPRIVAQRVDELDLAGIGSAEEPMGKRVAPQRTVGSTIVGFTGIDDQGLAGIEYDYNASLNGRAGSVTEETDSAGFPIPFGKRTVRPAQAGATVVLTIDGTLQFAADEVLRSTAQRYHARDGSAIVMRAQTGEILALSNWPDYDPNRFAASPSIAWKNQAITDPYEPGSTFKMITAAAALDSGKVSLNDTFAAVDAIRVGGRVIHNADDGLMASGHARETLDDIVAFSHNVGAAQVALRIGKATMYDYIRRFGFDNPTGVDLPGESAGLVGTPDDWWGSRLATIGFGQGVSVTPLALARAYATIANGGVLMRPFAVRYLVSPEGRIIDRREPLSVRRVMSPQTAAELLAMLRDVVRRGTARGLALPGYALAGKTGTAQMVIDGSYVSGAYTSSFVGIVPAEKPQYVILVKIDEPKGEYYGSIVAAPAFRRLAAKVLWREGILPRRSAGVVDLLPAQGSGTAAGDVAGQTRNRH